jgi:hypothetical protein
VENSSAALFAHGANNTTSAEPATQLHQSLHFSCCSITTRPSHKLGEIAGSAPEGAYAALVDFAASIGYSLVPHPENDEAEGRCNYEQRTISVQTAQR